MDELACFAPGMLALGSSGYEAADSQKFSLAEEKRFLGMAALLCKRGAAAHFSKSSSSSSTWTSRRCISRSLAESSSNVGRIVNSNTLGRGGRWAAVRGYNDDASANSVLPDELQKAMQLEIQKVRREIEKRNAEALERYFTSLQLETGKLRNEMEKRDKESSEELQSVTQELRSEIIGHINQLDQKIHGVRGDLKMWLVLIHLSGALWIWTFL